MASRRVDTSRPVISPAELSALGPPRDGASASISSMKTTAGAAARAAAKTPYMTGWSHQQLGHGRKQSRHQAPSHPSFCRSCLPLCQHICEDRCECGCFGCYRGALYSRAGQMKADKRRTLYSAGVYFAFCGEAYGWQHECTNVIYSTHHLGSLSAVPQCGT